LPQPGSAQEQLTASERQAALARPVAVQNEIDAYVSTMRSRVTDLLKSKKYDELDAMAMERIARPKVYWQGRTVPASIDLVQARF